MDRGDDQDGEVFEFNGYRAKRSDQMMSGELRALHEYWDRLRAGRRTPYRNEIDPRDMTCDVRNLFILENLGRGNIRFRLAGTAIVEAFGMELRGMNARAIMSAASRESFTALIAEALEDPGTGFARLVASDDENSVWEVSLLPLRSDFGMTDRIIGCLVQVAGAKRTGQLPLRFRIEHMSVEPIETTTREFSRPNKVRGFAEPQNRRFVGKPAETAERGLKAIDGGLSGDRSDDQPRDRGHLRIVKD